VKWELDTEAEEERKQRLEKIRIQKEKVQQERERVEATAKEKQERNYLTALLSRTPAPDHNFRPGTHEIPKVRTKGLKKSARDIFETARYDDNLRSVNADGPWPGPWPSERSD
jgi:hypothetical protein